MGYEKVKEWRSKQPNIRELRAEEARKWRAAHPDVAKAIKNRYRERNRERILPREAAQAAARRKQDPAGQKRRNEAYRARQMAKQVELAGRPKPDLCEICNEIHLHIVFDHCHSYGHFRGWICDRCNKVLGLVYDSSQLLQKLGRYLEDGIPKDGRSEEKISP